MVSHLRADNYELMMICSDYSTATPEVNAQIAKIDAIVKRYDPKGMVIGEAPLILPEIPFSGWIIS